VVSLSEPYWYEQLARYASSSDPAEAGQLLELCASLDFPLFARLLPPSSSPTTQPLYALNGKAFAHSLLEPVVHRWNGARHVFMYRDVVEVVESFQSIFAHNEYVPTLTGCIAVSPMYEESGWLGATGRLVLELRPVSYTMEMTG
jgi:hypothetical protein